jgi:hypothetical protein
MKFLTLLFFYFAAQLTQVSSEETSDVVTLTPDTFDQVIDGSKGQLVEFYAPW